MKLAELLRDIEVLESHASPELEIADVAYDSRQVTKGAAFVAIRGFESDGHKYIPQAAEKGASCVICEEKPALDVPYVVVRDSRLALAVASKNFFGDPGGEMVMLGVTGTNGKTTTTYLIKHLLEQKRGATVGLIGTNGNMIGSDFLPTERTTPESYELQKLLREMADAGCTHVIMEVSSHSLVLHRVAGLHFAVGIFTNLTQDHLDFHKTMAEYARAKSLLFDMCDRAVINLDDEWSEYMLEHCPCPALTFSEGERGDLTAHDIELASSGVSFTAGYEGRCERVRLGIPGLFSVYNALGVMGCGLSLGIDLADCADSLASAKGVKGRVEVVPTDGDYTILIDYAHTPDGLENLLRTARTLTKSRLITVFGCGGERDRGKRRLMGETAAKFSDFVIVTSDNPRFEDPSRIIDDITVGMKGTEYKTFVDRTEAIAYAMSEMAEGDTVVIAGKGSEDYLDIRGKKVPYSDFDTARRWGQVR